MYNSIIVLQKYLKLKRMSAHYLLSLYANCAIYPIYIQKNQPCIVTFSIRVSKFLVKNITCVTTMAIL